MVNNETKKVEQKRMSKEEIIASEFPYADKSEMLAKYYFSQGYNCAESVLLSSMDIFGTDLPPEIIGLATGFGGGMGRTRDTCGAVTGAVMALGLKKGRQNPQDIESPKERSMELREIYMPFAQMVTEIKDNYGTINCSELTDPHKEFEGKERKRSCLQIVGYCARKVAEHIGAKA